VLDHRQQKPVFLSSSYTANSNRAFREDYLVQLRLTSHQLEDVGYVASEVRQEDEEEESYFSRETG